MPDNEIRFGQGLTSTLKWLLKKYDILQTLVQ